MALPISLTGQTPTSARAPGLNSAPAEVGEMWGTWQMCILAFLHSRKVWFWAVLINESENSFVFKLHYSLKQILFRTSYCSLPFSEFLRTLLTKFPTPSCQNQKFRNTNFASTETSCVIIFRSNRKFHNAYSLENVQIVSGAHIHSAQGFLYRGKAAGAW